MLRISLLAAALVCAPTAVLASGGYDDDYRYGSIVRVEPRIAISIGGGHHDRISFSYQAYGHPYHPVIVASPHGYRVHPSHHYRSDRERERHTQRERHHRHGRHDGHDFHHPRDHHD